MLLLADALDKLEDEGAGFGLSKDAMSEVTFVVGLLGLLFHVFCGLPPPESRPTMTATSSQRDRSEGLSWAGSRGVEPLDELLLEHLGLSSVTLEHVLPLLLLLVPVLEVHLGIVGLGMDYPLPRGTPTFDQTLALGTLLGNVLYTAAARPHIPVQAEGMVGLSALVGLFVPKLHLCKICF